MLAGPATPAADPLVSSGGTGESAAPIRSRFALSGQTKG